jgi:hypothetical protein
MPEFIINATRNPPYSLSLGSSLAGIDAQHAFAINPLVKPSKAQFMIIVAVKFQN